MAKTSLMIMIIPLTIFFFVATLNSDFFWKNLSWGKLVLFRPEKLSHIHFYFHDVVSGPNLTTVRIAEANTTNTWLTGFGAVNVIDDPLTVGPEPNSMVIGKAQGIYASASQSDLDLLMVLNYVFTEGEYSGSTLSILGHNAVFSTVREMPILGGTGLFRFARGYALAKTHSISKIRAIVEYNVYVLHY